MKDFLSFIFIVLMASISILWGILKVIAVLKILAM